jgi:peptide/nickel transport system substrate-binding protein
VVEWKREAQLVAEAHAQYWDAAPAAKRITFRLIPETATRVSALLAGEVDIITNLPPDQVETVEGDAGRRPAPARRRHRRCDHR